MIATKTTVVKKLMTEFSYNSVIPVPRVEKITLNMGVGEAIADKKLLDNAAAGLAAISGQKPLIHQSTQICCRLQNPSGLSDRL
ncbi:50S ribosomal protein L5 [Escherichia coli]|nr:50S ribosomal protein L5 [Escherichia coli]